MLTRITGGHVLDPANGVNRVQDLFIRDDRVVASPGAAGDGPSAGMDAASLTIDARDCVIMAGGIDIHSHIGGGKATLARLLTSDVNQDQPGKEAFLPTASRTAQRYLDMGYTAAFEPAVLPCNARAAHAEMRDVAGLDTGGYCLLGNDDVLLSMIADGIDQSVINDYVAWMVRATQAIAVKVVNPGGISAFKFETREFDVDTPHPKYGVTPAQLIRTLCEATQAIGLTHPLHVHCSNLGVPGNIRSTLKTIEAAQGLPIHLTHVQFHCYGANGALGMSSASEQLVAALDRHPNVTIDVGQVMFGQTVTISADTMHQHANFRLADPKKSILVDVECEAGCGVVPFRYRHRQYVHSLQWAIGLELFLMVDDPSRVFLTTDHPNGAPFTAYPHLIRLLCDRSFRATALAEIHRDAAAASQLGGLDREYSLEQIAVMTRSAPARILGLRNLGHLGPGAVADLVVYRNQADRQRMFERPEWVLRRGNVVRRPTAEFDTASSLDGIAATPDVAVTHASDVSFDPQSVQHFAERFRSFHRSDLHHFAIGDQEMADGLSDRVERHPRHEESHG